MAMFYVFMAFCLFVATSNISAKSSTCPNLKTKTDFNATRFAGRWYQAGLYTYSDDLSVIDYPCNRIDYIVYRNRRCTILHSDEIKKRPALTTYVPRRFTPAACNPAEPGRFMSSLNSVASPRNEWILETDYASYAVVYRCTEGIIDEEQHPVAILTKEINPSQSILGKAIEFVAKNILTRWPSKVFKRNNQTNC